MREEYEQLELDTRRQLDKAIAQLTEDTVKTAGEMITACGEAPTAVRNRHEAFGIAAERLAKIKKAVKAIDGDTSILLGTLPDANYPAIEAVSSVCKQHPGGSGHHDRGGSGDAPYPAGSLRGGEHRPERGSDPHGGMGQRRPVPGRRPH